VLTRPPATFGDLLRQHRQAAGLTQQALAERAGLSVHGIQKLERGATRPYRDTAQRLIAALQLISDERARFQAAVSPVRRHASTTPVAAVSDSARHNLPLPVTSLVGREAATREVEHLPADTRLLTLTGIGGCGKTRLALEVGRAVIDQYPDGVWLVELGPLADPALVTPRVATALGIRETAEQPLMSALSNALRKRHMLLVLDNCEHLLDACAQLIDGLLWTCPDVRVLATSREPVGIGGESVWRVPSLELPDAEPSPTLEQLGENPAVQLFVQRAAAAQSALPAADRRQPHGPPAPANAWGNTRLEL
jgi:transcriptional regulator with XRE-family HTH domain